MWFDKLDAGKQGTLSEAAIRDGIKEALPAANFAGQGGGRGRGGRSPGGGGTISLKTFAEQRRAFLLRGGEPSHP